MFRKYSVKNLVLAIMITTFFACEPYEEYVKDYNYSAVYFGTQKPLRTLVTRMDANELRFKAGVALGGILENKSDQWVTFELAPDLLTTVAGANGFTLLPADWYSFDITENKISIPNGKFMGDFTITIDKSKFTADPTSLIKKYALPFRIIESSADSVLRGDAVIKAKDYTIIVVKYINEFSGTYYVRGEQVELDSSGNEIASSNKTYYAADWSKNSTRIFTTTSENSCEMTGVGDQTTDKLKITFGANNSVSLSTVVVPVTDMNCTYADGVYRLKYKYIKGSKTYSVDEYIKQRNDPEKDLRFEEW
jgi:hypothetical protein